MDLAQLELKQDNCEPQAILVNGCIVNIPSYTVAPGDVITSKEGAKTQLRIQAALALSQAKPTCSWIEVDANELKGTFKQVPEMADLPPDVNVKLIVEFYSK